jgi:hypothetical protein
LIAVMSFLLPGAKGDEEKPAGYASGNQAKESG